MNKTKKVTEIEIENNIEVSMLHYVGVDRLFNLRGDWECKCSSVTQKMLLHFCLKCISS